MPSVAARVLSRRDNVRSSDSVRPEAATHGLVRNVGRFAVALSELPGASQPKEGDEACDGYQNDEKNVAPFFSCSRQGATNDICSPS